MKTTHALLISILILASTTLSACTVQRALEPPEQKGFIPYKEGEGVVTASYPFSYTWIMPGLQAQRYSKIYVAPVNVSLVGDRDWRRSRGTTMIVRTAFEKRLADLASYYQTTLINALQVGADNRFLAIEQPQKGSLRLEIALTEVVFGDPVAYAGSFALPVPGSSFAFDTVASPMLSCEGRVIDNDTGQIVAVFADRKIPQIKPFDLNKFSTSSPLREVIDRWTDEIVRSFNREGDVKVARSSAFSLVPW